MSNGNNRTKQLNAKARALREKEKRVRRQAGMLVHGNRIIDEAKDRGYAEGCDAGFQEGLKAALALAREHRRMTHFVPELRRMIKEPD